MKKNLLLLTIFSALTVYSVNAQQRPYYTQYILNNFIVNPAVAGIENYTDVKISHRMQWVGLQDAPVTTYFTIHAPTKKMNMKEKLLQVFMQEDKTLEVKTLLQIILHQPIMVVLV
jgi:type IX secretion system PorP/SprF family membrane protein